MKPVDQTIIDQGRGNCFTACLASILELPISEVPNFVADYGDNWQRELHKWLEGRGYYYCYIRHDKGESFPYVRGYYIMIGDSPRFQCYHSVVAKDYQMVHDPHPSRAGIGELRGFGIIAKIL